MPPLRLHAPRLSLVSAASSDSVHVETSSNARRAGFPLPGGTSRAVQSVVIMMPFKPSGGFSGCPKILRSTRRSANARDLYFAALPMFSATLNSTIRRIRSVGSGCPRGNCTEPFPFL
jgi:hypothetical protein